MKPKNLLHFLHLTLSIVFLVACGNLLGPVESTTTPTPESPPATLTPLPPIAIPDQVFNTPEEAITYYFEGLVEADAGKILQACAIDEMSEKFRFDLYTERLSSFTPFISPAPSDYPMFVEMNKTQQSAQVFNRVKIFTYSLLSSEEVGEGKTIYIDLESDTERISNFMQDVNPQRLAQLEVKKIELPDETLMNTDRYLENAAKLASLFGADESTERVALFSFKQNYYYVGFTLLRYGENWKISEQVSRLGNTNPLGAAERTTVEEFESMINND